MNESKTPFSEGWLETARNDNNGIKIAHYFKNEKSMCGKYTDIPADVIVNESPSIHCKDCEDKMKSTVADKKDDESDIGKNEDCCQGSNDECKTDERSTEDVKNGPSENIPSAEQDSEMKHDTETPNTQS